MKIFVVALSLLLTAFMIHSTPANAAAASSNGDGTIDIDLLGSCQKTSRCEINYKGIKIIMTGTGIWQTSIELHGLAGESVGRGTTLMINPTLISNVPIVAVRISAPTFNYIDYPTDWTRDGINRDSSNYGQAWTRDVNIVPAQKKIFLIPNYDGNHTASLTFDSVRVKLGNPETMADTLTVGSTSLLLMYRSSAEYLEQFKMNVKASDRRHLDRFAKALADGEKSLGVVNDTPTVSVTHRQVTEAARTVVVMGTVLDELLSEYADVPALQLPITNLRSLVKVLRENFGFGDNFAGKGSTAIASLASVIEFEAREILLVLSSTNNDSVNQVLNSLLSKAQMLRAKVMSNDGGDAMALQRTIELASVWNSTDMQTVLKKLMNAGPDSLNLIQPKLKILFMSVESLNDLTKVPLTIPGDIDAQTNAATIAESGKKIEINKKK